MANATDGLWTVRVTHGKRVREHIFDTKREAHSFAQSKRRTVQSSGKLGNIRRVGPGGHVYSVYATGNI